MSVFVDQLQASDLVPLVRSLAVSELCRVREPWGVKQAAREWGPETTLDEVGIGLDSLALLSLAGRVADQFGMDELGTEDYLLARRRLIDWAELIVHTWTHVKRPGVRFASSGTTGGRFPKKIWQGLDTLEEEVAALLSILPAADAVAAYVPAHHIYGFLFTVMMPVMEGVPVIESYLNPATFRPAPETRIVSIPDHWRVVAQQGGPGPRAGGNGARGGGGVPGGAPAVTGGTLGRDPAAATGRGRQAAGPAMTHGVSSTAPLSSEVAAQVRDRMPLYEIYGSTESAGVGYRSVTDAPYTLLPHWVRESTDPQAIRRIVHGEQVAVRLMDRIEWHGDRNFMPRGRLDNVVQVGGHNVDLDAVADRIRDHPRVADCVVRLMAPGEGERMKAFVVPAGVGGGDAGGQDARIGDTPDASDAGRADATGGSEAPSNQSDLVALQRELEQWIRGRLGPHECPAHYTFGVALPRSEMGKLTDWSIDPDS